MTQTISGNLSGPARVIILNESDMAIEHNTTTSGSYEVSGLSDGPKVVLARSSDGETFGYASVSGIAAAAGLVELMKVTSCAEQTTELIGASSGTATNNCGTQDGLESTFLRCTSYAGAGENSSDDFPVNGISTIEFYNRPAREGDWYNDNLGQAAFYLVVFSASDYDTSGSYGQVVSPALMRIHFRMPTTQITYLDVVDDTSSTAVSTTMSDAYQIFRPFAVEINWGTRDVKVWEDGSLKLTTQFSANLLDYIGNDFKIGFHWHSYLDTAIQHINAIKVSSGERNDVITTPFSGGANSMVESEWTLPVGNGSVTNGILNLQAVSAAAEESNVAEWNYLLNGDFDLIIYYDRVSYDDFCLAGLRIIPENESSFQQNGLYIDRRMGSSLDNGFYCKHFIDGVTTPDSRYAAADTAYDATFLRIRRTNNTFYAEFGAYPYYYGEALHTINIDEWAGKRMRVQLGVYKWGTAADISCNFDRLRVIRGNVVQP